jgi:hypothetical protein
MVGKVPPGGPHAIAFDSANGNLYVPILHNYTVTVISGKNNTVLGGPIHVGIGFDSTNGDPIAVLQEEQHLHLNIKRIFLVLDNTSIHKSKKSPKFNIIEVRCMWLQRKAIDNSTFRNQSDIGQAVQEWTENYNATHGRRITDILQIGVMPWVT